jgi:putative inorganic carbon (HCO3(-)) transporter
MAELAVFFLLYGKESRRTFLISLIPIAIWLPFFPHSVVNRFSSIATVTESSISYRLYTWQSTLRLLWAHPFGIGIGEDSFSAVYRNFAISGTETVMHAHNLFLQIAIELGVGGLLCLLAILLFFLQTVCRVFFQPERTMPLGVILGGFCAILGALVMGMFDYIWYQYGLLWLFWVMVALTVGAIREVDEKQARGVDLIL